MALYAELDELNRVSRVVVIDSQEMLDENGIEQESLGVAFCETLFGGGRWLQTSYNGAFRKNYAGIGYVYRQDIDAFVPPEPISPPLTEGMRWSFDNQTARWVEVPT